MKKCKVDGCVERYKAKGYCAFHYDRVRQKVPFDKPRRPYNPGNECSIENCNKPAIARGWCSMHHQRWRTRGDPLDAGKNREYGSGKEWHSVPTGYIVRYEPENPNAGPNGQVYQHRHVMSQMIGRPLTSGENVHHINGDKADNRPENLELWTSMQPPGQRTTDRVEWCIDVLLDEQILRAAIMLRPDLLQKLKHLAKQINAC